MRSAFAALAAFGLLASMPAASARLAASSSFAVAPQYDTTHVYVAPEDVDRFVQTLVGTVSLFGFRTGIPYPFGAERTGYLVTDLDWAVASAKAAGADVLAAPFPDPIGRDAVIQWPGGLAMQLYWHRAKPDYPAFQTVPENRVYTSPERADALVRGFVRFSRGRIVADDAKAPGEEIGLPGTTHRRIRVESAFGKMTVFATDGHLPYPYGREITGYEVGDLDATLAKAKAAGVSLLVDPAAQGDRRSAMVRFPGGYVAEIHQMTAR